MEKIKIVSILDKKTAKGGIFWAVNYDNVTTGQKNCNATIGQWHAPVAKFIGERVGLGGVCEVKITQKGKYTNIEEVNEEFNYVVPKGELPLTSDGEPNFVDANTGAYNMPKESKLMSVKDINIMAQTFTKCFYYNTKAESANEVMMVFNDFVKLLENNG